MDSRSNANLEDPDLESPNFWYYEAWYHGVTFAALIFVFAAGVLAVAAWTKLDVLFQVAAMLAFAGCIPLFGGVASLLRRIIGARALKYLVVTVVVLIILGCATFLILVATSTPKR